MSERALALSRSRARGSRRAAAIFLVFAWAYFLSYFFRSANAVIAPDLSAELALGPAELGLMTSLFFGVFAALQPLVGAALDRWGPRWVVPALMLVGACGSLVFASAQSLGVLALGRALTGAGMAAILMGAMKALSLWLPPERFASATGLLMGLGASGALVAATPLAWLSGQLGWRTAFTWGALVLAATAATLVAVVRNAPPGREWPRTAGAATDPLVAFRDARVWRIGAVYFCMAGVLIGVQGLWAGPYLFDVSGLSRLQAGNVLLWLGVGSVLGYVASGRLGDRFGLVPTTLAGGIVFAACQVALAAGVPPVWVPAIYFLFGFSGSFYVLLFAQGRLVFPAAMTGRAVSALNMLGVGGVFLLQWWFGAIVALFPAGAGGQAPPAAYTAAFLFTATITLAALAVYLPFAREIVGARRERGPSAD